MKRPKRVATCFLTRVELHTFVSWVVLQVASGPGGDRKKHGSSECGNRAPRCAQTRVLSTACVAIWLSHTNEAEHPLLRIPFKLCVCGGLVQDSVVNQTGQDGSDNIA